MKKLQCELCGSIDIVKTANDLFECQHCGCKYTKAQAMALIQGTVETYSGNTEFQRQLKAAKSLFDLGDYMRAFVAFDSLTSNFSYEADAWTEFCLAALAWIRKTKTIETHCKIEQKPIHSVCLKDLYDRALQLTDHKTDLQKQWNSFWEDAACKLESGDYLLNFSVMFAEETIQTVSTFHPAMQAAMEKARSNAQILVKHELGYGTALSSTGIKGLTWMPNKKNNFSVRYALGKQLLGSDPNRDYTGVPVLPFVISCTEDSLMQYQAQSIAYARKCYDNNVCPYCDRGLESKFFGKECRGCGKIKRP